ncbi:carbohydrate ABC transporter permease [Halomarina ordinaria]|uniref:Carbohydrate ABC transporter permease n=1 Tax=Halomarina ordinaria TaxID=3033939 RepID=A0ABD5UC04_9EURY|nr:sugar ABC transporter permease [Halomarina sp. PSRA2]
MGTETETRTQRDAGGGRSGAYTRSVRWLETLDESQFAYLLLAPVFLLLGLIAFWPLLSTFELSLHADRLTGATRVGEFVGLQNYVELFTGQKALVNPFFSLEQPLQSALVVTLVFTVVSVLFETVIGFGQALVLDQDFRGRRWVRVAIILPWAVPIVIQGMIFYLMFQPGVGFAVGPLSDLGIISSQPFNDLGSSLLLIIVADIWKTSAFMALLILAGLQSIDRSLYDVARVSGASRVQQFRYITLPLVIPTVAVAMLFRTIDAARVFGLIEASGAGCTTVPSLSCQVVTTFFTIGRYGTAAAIAFTTAGIISLLVAVNIARLARGGL